MHAIRLLRYIATAGLIIAGTAALCAAEQHTWTSADGKFKVVAELLDVKGDEIVLRKADGTVVSVPLPRLSEPDRAFAKSAKRGSNSASQSPNSPPPTAEVAFRGREPGTLTRTNGSQQSGFLLELNAKKVRFHAQGQRSPFLLDARDVAKLHTATDTYTFDAATRGFLRKPNETNSTRQNVVSIDERRADIESIDGGRTRVTGTEFVGDSLFLNRMLFTVRSKNYEVGIPFHLVRSITLKDDAYLVIYSHQVAKPVTVLGQLYDGQFEFHDPELGKVKMSLKKLKSLVFVDVFENNEEALSRDKLNRKGEPRHRFTFADGSQIVVYFLKPVGVPDTSLRSNEYKPFFSPAVKLDADGYTIDLPIAGDLDFGPNRAVTATLPSGRRISGSLRVSYPPVNPYGWLPAVVPFDGFESYSESLGPLFIPLSSIKKIEANCKED